MNIQHSELNIFSNLTKNSLGNYIAPQRRAQSSMAPTIVTDKNGKVRMVIGAAGGPKIPTSILLVCFKLQKQLEKVLKLRSTIFSKPFFRNS